MAASICSSNQAARAFGASGLALGKKSRHDSKPTEYWTRYRQFTRTSTDRADTILRRYQFFAEKVHELLKPQLKDPTRIYGNLAALSGIVATSRYTLFLRA